MGIIFWLFYILEPHEIHYNILQGDEHDLKGREDFPEKREGGRNPKGITVCTPKTSTCALR